MPVKENAIHYYDCNTGKVWRSRKLLNISHHLPYGPVKTIRSLEYMLNNGMTHMLCVGYESDTQLGIKYYLTRVPNTKTQTEWFTVE